MINPNGKSDNITTYKAKSYTFSLMLHCLLFVKFHTSLIKLNPKCGILFALNPCHNFEQSITSKFEIKELNKKDYMSPGDWVKL